MADDPAALDKLNKLITDLLKNDPENGPAILEKIFSSDTPEIQFALSQIAAQLGDNSPFTNAFTKYHGGAPDGTEEEGKSRRAAEFIQDIIITKTLNDIINDLSFQKSNFESAADALGLDYEFVTFGALPEKPVYDTQVKTLSSVFETAGGWGSESENALLHTMNESTQGIDLNAEEMSDAEIMGIKPVTFGTAPYARSEDNGETSRKFKAAAENSLTDTTTLTADTTPDLTIKTGMNT